MHRPFVLSMLAAAVVGGCATKHPITSAPAPVVVVAPAAPMVVTPAPMVALRTGFGRIESLLAIPAAAGGTPSSTRVAMRMDDGSLQYFDTRAAGMAVNDRIEITKDGTLRNPG